MSRTDVSHQSTGGSIKRTFYEVYNGQGNIMAPDPVGYGTRGKFIYEISKGEFMRETIYGVTVLTRFGEKTHLNKGGFTDMEQVEEYINDVVGAV